MAQWSYHTPDGFSDWLPDLCFEKRALEDRLRSLFRLAAYREVQTPGFEFIDVYAAGDGFASPEALFKTFDPQGRILAARFDGTVGVARLAATKLSEAALPIRLSYVEDMYRYQPAGVTQLKAFTQAGLELIGSEHPSADGEVIAMAIRAAKACGLSQIQVAIGQTNFYKSMLAAWAVSGEAARRLTMLIDAMDAFGIEAFCVEQQLPDRACAVIRLMLEGRGSYEQLNELMGLVDCPAARQALENLRSILDYLADQMLLPHISIDLGMLQSLNYYTGMIFKGYTHALGSPLFSGGRYDRVMEAFGEPLPATGFSIGVDDALTARLRQGELPAADPAVPHLVAYAPGYRAAAMQMAEQLRNSGQPAELDLAPSEPADAADAASARGAARLYYVGERSRVLDLPAPMADALPAPLPDALPD